MIDLDIAELRSWFGFGVAGNFAGHLEQAGEAADFVNVTSEGVAPKGIFPWYAPGSDSFLGEFPLSNDAIVLPAESDAAAQPADRARGRPGLPGRCGAATPLRAAAVRARRVQRLLDPSPGGTEDQRTRRTGGRRPKALRRSSSTSAT